MIGHDERGRLCAEEVQYLNRTQPQPVKKKNRSASLPVTAALLILLGLALISFRTMTAGPNQVLTRSSSAADKVISNDFQEQQSGVPVGGEGVVERVLSDDDGVRHQRLLLRLVSD